jgi:hypothetical protein
MVDFLIKITGTDNPFEWFVMLIFPVVIYAAIKQDRKDRKDPWPW